MEGKGVLFKRFADVDVFDINVNCKDVDLLCKIVKSLEPTFGGINLEDIKAPECFVVEERLKKEMNIPVFHDDQHGTAIISGAALLGALELNGKKIDQIRVVVSGAGASAIACTKFYLALGVKVENVIMVDTKGVVYKGRTEGMNEYKAQFASDTKARTLVEAAKGADVLLGCSVKGQFTQDMIKSMAKDPIVFALANPDPEISYPEAKEAREDVIMATGRSDYPNQVNNVLGFPYLFRGALDVRARQITEEMKMAAARALAELAKQDVPEAVSRAYGGEKFRYGREYIIPKPLDPRVLLWVAPAVAKAAMDGGVARVKIDLDEYRERLKKMLSRSHQVMGNIFEKTKSKLTKIVFAEGNHPKILQAAQILREDAICEPILLGPVQQIKQAIADLRLDALDGVQIIAPEESPDFERYVQRLWELRQRRGTTHEEARRKLRFRNYFGSMMVELGDADGLVTGLTTGYADAIRPPLEVLQDPGRQDRRRRLHRGDQERLQVLRRHHRQRRPVGRGAGRDRHRHRRPGPLLRRDPAGGHALLLLLRQRRRRQPAARCGRPPSWCASGARTWRSTARSRWTSPPPPRSRSEEFPFSTLTEDANVFVFPNLDSANIAYQMLERVGGAEVIGPVLLGMHKPVNVLQMGCSVQAIVNLAAITALRAQGEQFTF